MNRIVTCLAFAAALLFGSGVVAQTWQEIDVQLERVESRYRDVVNEIERLRVRYAAELAEVDRLKASLLRAAPLSTELPRALRRAHETGLALAAADAQARELLREANALDRRLDASMDERMRAGAVDADELRAMTARRVQVRDARPAYDAAAVATILRGLDETPDELVAAADELEDLARRMERRLEEVASTRQREATRSRLVRRARQADGERALFDDGGVRRNVGNRGTLAANAGSEDDNAAPGPVAGGSTDAPPRGGLDGSPPGSPEAMPDFGGDDRAPDFGSGGGMGPIEVPGGDDPIGGPVGGAGDPTPGAEFLPFDPTLVTRFGGEAGEPRERGRPDLRGLAAEEEELRRQIESVRAQRDALRRQATELRRHLD